MNELKDRILIAVKEDLKAIESALSDHLNPYLEEVSQTAQHILFSGGKRLRPLLMVLSARICNYTGNYDKIFSTIFEFLHTATLLHDDLVDGAELRRGQPVAHAKWGNSMAVLVGDFLFARALSIAADTMQPKIIKIIATITESMSQGEIQQLLLKGKPDLSQEEYLDVIRSKTAVLIQGACQTGALIAGAPEVSEKALSTYGFNLGMAFQIIDDLLDYTADTSVLGKTAGMDLREGKLTLPVIHALERADSQDKTLMNHIIADKDFSEKDFDRLVGLLNKYDGLTYAKDKAFGYIKKSKESLSVFKPSPPREILMDMADYTLARNL